MALYASELFERDELLSVWQAFWLALLKGTTEILPVSSLGHGVILPSLLGWHVDQESPTFVPFFVVLHLGTSTALFAYFRREWAAVIAGFFRTLRTRNLGPDRDGRLAWLLAAGTVPAGLVGIVFEKALSANFARPSLAAVFLVLNGVLLLLGERLRRRRLRSGASCRSEQCVGKDARRPHSGPARAALRTPRGASTR